MKFGRSAAFLFLSCLISTVFLAPRMFAQSGSNFVAADSEGAAESAVGQAPTTAAFKGRYLWTEEFEGSSNEDGKVMELDSTVGYVFSRHFGVDAGIPILFVRGSSTNALGMATNTSENGLGDAYLQLRFAFANPVLNYKTALTGTAPTGSRSAGISTGHATYDWTNHFDRAFGKWVPFADAGAGNSILENFVFQRAFSSYGHDAHFQVGTGYKFTDWLAASASAYDISAWGTQTIFSRVVGVGGAPVGKGRHGRVFELANETTGGSSLASDRGFSAGVDLSPGSLVDFSASYSYSGHLQLNTFSFGIGVNVSEILRHARAED